MKLARKTFSAIPFLICAAFILSLPVAARDTRSDATSSAKTKKASAKSKAKSGTSQAAVNPREPTLLAQYTDWGAYVATPGGKKVCFALSKPKSTKASKDDIKRDQAYMFIATRPTDKVKNEVSIIVGYPLNPKADMTAQVGSNSFAMLTQNDGAWIKNPAEEPQLVEAMRKGSDMIIKATSTHGTHTTDTYSLMGISDALDRVAKECGGSG